MHAQRTVASVVGIDDASSHVDVFLPGEAGAGGHTPIGALRTLDGQVRLDDALAARLDHSLVGAIGDA